MHHRGAHGVVPISQPVEVQKEVRPVKEVDSAIEPTALSKAEPLPESVFITLNVQFETGKANIQPKYHNDIKSVADIMREYPSTLAVIEGHTDSQGSDEVNQGLSASRAKAVAEYFMANMSAEFPVNHEGYGESRPVASNDSAEGRARNRRVSFILRMPVS